MSTRIYSVEAKTADEFYLVEASSKGAALRHIASRIFDVSVANQKTLVDAIRGGVQVDVAGEEPAPAAE